MKVDTITTEWRPPEVNRCELNYYEHAAHETLSISAFE